MAVPADRSESADPQPMDIRAAFRAAVQKHSEPAADAAAGADDEEADVDEGEAGADDADVEDEGDVDTTADPEVKAKTAKPAAKAATTKAAADPSGLLTDEEFTALQAKHGDDGVGLRKSLESAFTKKTQALSEQRRSYERLSSYADLIDAYEENPEATIRALAKHQGFTLTAAGEAGKTTPDETASAVEDVLKDFKADLGPGLEDIADSLAPALTKLVERLTAGTVERVVKPLKASQQTLLDKTAAEQTDVVMTKFGETYPDWKDHEPAMLELAQRIDPKGMEEGEFLALLYKIASRDAWDRDRTGHVEKEAARLTKKRTDRMTRSAADADTTRTTPEGQVRKRPAGRVSFEDAYEAAKRGERYED